MTNSAVAESDCAVVCIWPEAEASVPTRPFTFFSKLSASFTLRVTTAQLSIAPA
ncbi:hypothetical protein [Bradyrhizobium sp. Leo170]|uniref:hypothetical protein n=1 Tax=Bradyrhizobium sp. Leo170 TaxID=1571199 RepID=UPI001FDEEE48|nr:hypothetical protein [Bradyrhizobium sp. Leo170]